MLAGVAAATCNPGRAGVSVAYEAGWAKQAGSGTCFDGSLGSLTVYQPYVNGFGAGADVELDNSATGSHGAIGWELSEGVGFVSFAEVRLANGGYFFQDWQAPAVGSSATYKVTYIGTTFHFFENDNNYYNYSAPSYSGCDLEQGGFVSWAANQMPGGRNSPNTVQHSENRHLSDGQWYYTDAPAFILGPSGWYGSSKDSSTQVSFWDKACAN